MDSLKENLHSVAVGIKYLPNFGLVENSGKIVDDILYDKDSPFNDKFFDEAQRNTNEIILLKKGTSNYFRINPNDVILEYYSKDYSQIDTVLKDYDDYVIKNLLMEYELSRILRIGIIHRFFLKGDNITNKFKSNFLDGKFGSLSEINIRFTRKKLTNENFKKGINNFENILYTINSSKVNGESGVLLSVDYQKVYDPQLSETSLIDFKTFRKKVEMYLSKEVSEWVKGAN